MHRIAEQIAITRAERAVLEALVEHDRNEGIADELFLSVSTVKSHLYRLTRKLQVNSRHRLIARAYQWGFLTVDGSGHE